jgi:hypothetical protein
MYVTLRSAANSKNRTLFDAGGQLILKQEGSNLIWHGPEKDGASSPWIVAKGAVVPGRRIHLAAVSTARELRLFVDGRLAGQGSLEAAIPATRLCAIGGVPTAGPKWEPLDGLIDQVRISTSARYDKEFVPDERFTADKDTFARYLFDEGQGEELKDSSGNNNHGKIIGAKWVQAEDGSPKVESPKAKTPPPATP